MPLVSSSPGQRSPSKSNKGVSQGHWSDEFLARASFGSLSWSLDGLDEVDSNSGVVASTTVNRVTSSMATRKQRSPFRCRSRLTENREERWSSRLPDLPTGRGSLRENAATYVVLASSSHSVVGGGSHQATGGLLALCKTCRSALKVALLVSATVPATDRSQHCVEASDDVIQNCVHGSVTTLMMQYRARTGWKLSEIRKPEGSEETAAELRGPLAVVLEIHRSHRTGRNVEQCGGTRGDDDNEERALTDRTTRRVRKVDRLHALPAFMNRAPFFSVLPRSV
ncbi:hypothetical protein AXG93_3437s1070 [Marchantia polymorpha subsp. ruderalis]|uniref:Uncharacterized protein n=1 Tax=Marchantia polymorpha subsp. ruderalis TaxID=1480154 RepID=A0A176VZ09_MARPO|nr:hypothetical protein AXG93_3437s1070 [Marchantia polymorpha subsp. ruderalis]